MTTQRLQTTDPNHAHDVSLEGTFDFVNTYDLENTFDIEKGFAVDRLPTLEAALAWFVERGVIHYEGAERWREQTSAEPSAGAEELARIHAVRAALREVADSIAEERAPDPAALDTVNRALHARQVIELIPAWDGVSVDHRHVGDPIDDALARLADPLVRELTGGHPERIRICDNDTLPLGLLRHLADGPPALVRHGDLWQPGQGGPPPSSGEGWRGRRGR